MIINFQCPFCYSNLIINYQYMNKTYHKYDMNCQTCPLLLTYSTKYLINYSVKFMFNLKSYEFKSSQYENLSNIFLLQTEDWSETIYTSDFIPLNKLSTTYLSRLIELSAFS